MLNSGWFRLWLVALATGVIGFIAYASYSLWGEDACYRYVSISSSDRVSNEDKQLVDGLQTEAKSRTYCGETQYSILVTLEQLAKRRVVNQIGIQWKAPKGWSFDDFETLDVLDRPDIRAPIVLARVQKYVQEARLRSFIPWVVALVALAVTTLALGVGIAWVRRGFSKQGGDGHI